MNITDLLESIQGKSLTGDIIIGEPDYEGMVSIYYTGAENVTIIVTVNGEEVEYINGRIKLNEGHSTITAIVTANGYNTKSKTVDVEWHPLDDPHLTGYWIVFLSRNGDKVWYQLLSWPTGGYYNMIDCPKALFGEQSLFYFMIDGCPYGACEESINYWGYPVDVYLSDYEVNPLRDYPSGIDNQYYMVQSGYGYMLGVHIYSDNITGDFLGFTCFANQYYEIILQGDLDYDGFVNIDDV